MLVGSSLEVVKSNEQGHPPLLFSRREGLRLLHLIFAGLMFDANVHAAAVAVAKTASG